MDASQRWTAVAFLVGFCAAYSLWGGGVESYSLPATPVNVAPRIPDAAHPTHMASINGVKVAPRIPNPTPGAQSALQCKPFRLDFGDIPLGEEVVQTVEVENKSSSPVTILEIEASCGCTVGKMANRCIEAGKSEPMLVSFHAEQGRRAGMLTLTLTTNETGYPRIILPVEGRSRLEFISEPDVLKFGELKKNESKRLTTKLIRTDGKPFTIQQVMHKNKEFSFDWKPLSEASGGSDHRSGYEISATALGTRPGQWTETAVVMVDHSRVKSVSLTVLLEVAPEVVFTPSNLRAEQKEDKTVEAFQTVLKRQTIGRLEVEEVKDSVDLPLKFTTERIDDSSLRLSIQFSGVYPQRIPFGQFLVKTNTDEEPLPLPYMVRMLVPGKKP